MSPQLTIRGLDRPTGREFMLDALIIALGGLTGGHAAGSFLRGEYRLAIYAGSASVAWWLLLRAERQLRRMRRITTLSEDIIRVAFKAALKYEERR